MLIAIEGITGVGKTTLQNLLLQKYSSEILIQEFENHPYLATTNTEITQFGLEREMIFLFMAYHQLKQLDTTNKLIISDFIFEKLKVFAVNSLSKDELKQVYYPCFNYLREKINRPDLIIHLIGSPSFALSNIRHRNRPGEEYLAETHLLTLGQSFDSLFTEYDYPKIITINAEESNLVGNLNGLREIVQQLELNLPALRTFRHESE